MNQEELLRDPYVAAFPETLAFWEAAGRGVLVLPRCQACGQVHWHPRAHCPFCRADAIAWEPASGRGTLHTYSVIRGKDAAHVLAYVQLEEGPLMLTNIVDTPFDALRIGMPVQALFRATPQGRMAPVFR